MKVRTVVRFRDMKMEKIRELGEEFLVSESHGRKLCDLGYVKQITEQKSEEAAK